MNLITGELAKDIDYQFVPESVEKPETVTGKLVITPRLELAEVDTPPFVTLVDNDWSDGEISIRLETSEKTRGSFQLRVIGDEYFLPILSAPIFFAVTKAKQGYPEIAHQTIKEHYSSSRYAWEFRSDCRDTVQFDTFIEVMDTLGALSEQFQHVMYRSATGYFSNRIFDSGPQNISSFEELKNRVEKWNQKETFASVSIDDVLAEHLGRNWIHGHLLKERDELKDLGVAPLRDLQPDSISLAGWIAHLLLTEGEYAAKEFVQELSVPVEKSYSELKDDAFDLNENRWEGWGRVIPITVQKSEDNFHYDLYQYLRFAGMDYRGNAKIQPLLNAGAAVLTGPLPAYFHQRVMFQLQISLGHQYRRDTNWEAAKVAFQRAESIATGRAASEYDFDGEKAAEAIASLAHAEASLLARKGDEAAIREKYDSAVEDLNRISDKYNISVNHHISFLEDQRQNKTSGSL